MSSYEPNTAIVVLYDSKEYKALDKKSGGQLSSICGLKGCADKDDASGERARKNQVIILRSL